MFGSLVYGDSRFVQSRRFVARRSFPLSYLSGPKALRFKSSLPAQKQITPQKPPLLEESPLHGDLFFACHVILGSNSPHSDRGGS